MVKYAENFLTKEECQYFINLIDKKHNRSSVSTTSDAYSEVSDYRTSSTSQFDKNDKVVCYVTGNGLKATESIMTVLKKPQVMQADVAKISAVIG